MLKVEDFKEVKREIRGRNPITDYEKDSYLFQCNSIALKHYIKMLKQYESITTILLENFKGLVESEGFENNEEVDKAIYLLSKESVSEVEKVYILCVYDNTLNSPWWDFEDDEIIKCLGQEQFELYKKFEIEE